jgi:hypothetical protein
MKIIKNMILSMIVLGFVCLSVFGMDKTSVPASSKMELQEYVITRLTTLNNIIKKLKSGGYMDDDFKLKKNFYLKFKIASGLMAIDSAKILLLELCIKNLKTFLISYF